MEAINEVKRTIPRENALPGSIEFSSEIHRTREFIIYSFNNISVALEQDKVQAKWLKLGNLWPCITPITLLEQLRSTSVPQFGPRMKEILVEHAIAITGLQKLMRIEQDYYNKDAARFWAELHNQGHTNWRPEEHLNWLLEIDCNILIRAEQVDVAHAMMSLTLGSDSALQINMGQGEHSIAPSMAFVMWTYDILGKSSCIIPMIASELVDSIQLVRVIVPKTLLLQTAQLLQTRLGGLLGRYVSHVPFARKTPTSQRNIEAYWKIHHDIKTSSGVIIALPEHLLSFKLSGLQQLSDKRNSEAAKMLQIYQWKQDNCRDILDECDYTLSTRTQLIYPTGTQAAVDGHPYRWEVAKTLLHACHGHLWSIAKEYPQSIEVVERPEDSFPLVFFLRRDAEESLISRLIGDIPNEQILLLPVRGCSAAELTTIRQFISIENVGPGVLKEVKGLFNDNITVRKTLYLLRDLLVHRNLLLSLKKRWNVQYGIHPKRDPISVPFHSKGVPSEQAEWGHPDVAILLTCLSFYFCGLEIRQLRQGLEHLLKTDDPAKRVRSLDT